MESSLAGATDATTRVRALCAEATEFVRGGHARRAVRCAVEAQQLAASIGEPHPMGEAAQTLARCRFQLGEYQAAAELFRTSAREYQLAGDEHGAAAAHAGLGLAQHRTGQHEAATESLLHALDRVRELGLTSLQAHVHNGLASTYLALEQADEAEKHLAAGIALAEADDNRDALANLLLSETSLRRRHGEAISERRHDEARRDWQLGLDVADRALAIARQTANTQVEARCMVQSAALLRLLGHAGAARDALAMARALEQGDDSDVKAEALLELGRLDDASGDSEGARANLHEAIAVAERIGARTTLADAHLAMSAHAEAQGDLVSALAHHKRFHANWQAQLESTRMQAARSLNLRLEFQRATRQASELREQAAQLAEHKEVLERRADELAEVSEQDPLTGLLNRRALDTRIRAVLSASESEGLPMTIALIDIDHFKAINDRFSHGVGDAVLKQVADAVRAHCRVGDLPVRYGGDEFLIVLLGVGEDDAEGVLLRLKNAVDEMSWSGDAHGMKVGLSVGAATRSSSRSIAETIAAADRALYSAKAAGRNRVVCVGTGG